MNRKYLATANLVTISALSAAPAMAQETTLRVVEEVTVTAQRREQNAQQVPIVVNAIDAGLARTRGIDSSLDLPNLTPGLVYNQSTNAGLVFLRGVGAGTPTVGDEGKIAFYLDDVYLFSPTATMFDLNNIEHVEVLSGPQGTLFGRNALGGVVQVFTSNPQREPSAKTSVGYGNYSTLHTDFYATTGLSDTLAADVAVVYHDQADGFGTNLRTNQSVFQSEKLSVRTKWLYAPDDKTEVTFTLLNDRIWSDIGVSNRLLPGSLGRDGISVGPADFYDADEDFQSDFTSEMWLASLKLTRELGWAQLKNIVAYQDNQNVQHKDADYSATFINNQDPTNSFSRTWTEELQLLSPADSPIDWIAGFFYLDNKSGYDPVHQTFNPPNPAFGQYVDILVDLDTDSYALYGQATATLFADTRLTAGVRYTKDDKHIVGGFFGASGAIANRGDRKASWSNTTYRLSLDHNLSETILAYAAYNRGFKSGVLNATAPLAPPVAPEIIDDYEAGLKSELFDRRLRLNIGGFYYDYSGQQLQQLTPAGVPQLLNAASSEHYGVDASFDAAVTDRLSLQGSFEWLHAKYLEFPGAPATQRNSAGGNITVPMDFAGRDVLIAPRYSATLGAQYNFSTGHGDFLWAANYRYNDGFSWVIDSDDRNREESYSVFDISVLWTPPSGNWDVRLWGKNIGGEEYNTYVSTAVFGDWGAPAPPATYGFTLSLRL